jgi:hypothetical protein
MMALSSNSVSNRLTALGLRCRAAWKIARTGTGSRYANGRVKLAVPESDKFPDTEESWLKFSGSRSLARRILVSKI